MGTWASAVTTAVAPLCWESKTFLLHRVGRRFDHAAAAPGLSHPHPAQHQAAGDAHRRVHASLGAKKVFTLVAADAVRPVDASSDPRRGPAQGRLRAHGSLIYDERRRPIAPRSTRRCAPGPTCSSQRLHARHGRAAEGPLSRRLQGQDHGAGLCDQPEADRPDRPARGGRGRLHLRAVGRGQLAGLRASVKRARLGQPDPYTCQATTTSAWC